MELFKCDGLTKHKGDFCLKDVSFSFPKGRIVGLLGKDGFGKTTLIKTILGSYGIDQNANDAGDLWMDGHNFKDDPKEYRSGIGFVLLDNPFDNSMTPAEVGETYGYYYNDFDMDKYLKYLEEFDLPLKSAGAQLTGGQIMKLQMAFSLSHPTKLLLLDEPYYYIDSDFRFFFYDTIRSLADSGEGSVIFSSRSAVQLTILTYDMILLKRTGNVSTAECFGRDSDSE